MPQLDHEGLFNAQPFRWCLRETRAGAYLLDIDWLVLEFLRPPELDPIDIRERGYEINGAMWLVSTDGKPDRRTMELLMKVMGWSGDVEQFAIPIGDPGVWCPPMCEIKSVRRTYKDKQGNEVVRFDAKYVNPLGSKGRQGSTSTEALAALRQRFGGQLSEAVEKIRSGKPDAEVVPDDGIPF